MRIQAGHQFSTWFEEVKASGGPVLERAADLLDALRRLSRKPIDETATFKRVRQAARHDIWRVAHPYDPDAAVRILCWFPDLNSVVIALIGGDKAGIGDLWYDSATPRAESEVDRWLRENPGEQS